MFHHNYKNIQVTIAPCSTINPNQPHSVVFNNDNTVSVHTVTVATDQTDANYYKAFRSATKMAFTHPDVKSVFSFMASVVCSDMTPTKLVFSEMRPKRVRQYTLEDRIQLFAKQANQSARDARANLLAIAGEDGITIEEVLDKLAYPREYEDENYEFVERFYFEPIGDGNYRPNPKIHTAPAKKGDADLRIPQELATYLANILNSTLTNTQVLLHGSENN